MQHQNDKRGNTKHPGLDEWASNDPRDWTPEQLAEKERRGCKGPLWLYLPEWFNR